MVGPDVLRARSNEGHIHVSLDGRLLSLYSGLEQSMTGLAPGSHVVQAEFVAADHGPFRNRVIAAVPFTVTRT